MRRSEHSSRFDPDSAGESIPSMSPEEKSKLGAQTDADEQQRRRDDLAWRRAEACVIEKARFGDRRALELLWMRFEPKIQVFFRRMCRQYYLTRSEDAWGDVYIAVARSIHTFDPAKARASDAGAAFCNWAYRIAARIAVGQVIREQRVATVEVCVNDWDSVPETILIDPGTDLADHLIHRETMEHIYDKLSAEENPTRAEYLRLVAEGMSQQEAAVRVGINPSTGRSWLNRFRNDLEADFTEGAKA